MLPNIENFMYLELNKMKNPRIQSTAAERAYGTLFQNIRITIQ